MTTRTSGPGCSGLDGRFAADLLFAGFGAGFFAGAGLRAALFFALPRGEDPLAARERAGADVRDAMARP